MQTLFEHLCYIVIFSSLVSLNYFYFLEFNCLLDDANFLKLITVDVIQFSDCTVREY